MTTRVVCLDGSNSSRSRSRNTVKVFGVDGAGGGVEGDVGVVMHADLSESSYL